MPAVIATVSITGAQRDRSDWTLYAKRLFRRISAQFMDARNHLSAQRKQNMLKHGFRTGFVSLAFFVSACDSGEQGQQMSTPPTVETPAKAQEKQRDLSALDVCMIMPDQLVAQLLGNTVTQPGRRQDYGQAAQGCEYALGRAERGTGAGPFEYVFIYVNPPGSFGTLEAALATDQGLGQEVSGEAVSGIGDQAFAVYNNTEHAATLRVLRQDDVALEIKASNLEHTRKLAEATLERLGPR